MTMDTYASAAGDPTGFYDIAGLAPSVDAFFVMAYDMNNKDDAVPHGTAHRCRVHRPRRRAAVHGGGAALQGDPRRPVLRLRLAHRGARSGRPRHRPRHAAALLRRSWRTAGTSTGTRRPRPPGPRTRWEPQWHQTFFDNPTSLALKAQWPTRTTSPDSVSGRWAWKATPPPCRRRCEGGAPIVKGLPPGPRHRARHHDHHGRRSPIATRGTWNGAPVTLSLVDPATLAGAASMPASSPLTASPPTIRRGRVSAVASRRCPWPHSWALRASTWSRPRHRPSAPRERGSSPFADALGDVSSPTTTPPRPRTDPTDDDQRRRRRRRPRPRHGD